MNYNGPDSPPSIVLKAEPESSESNLNFAAVSSVLSTNHNSDANFRLSTIKIYNSTQEPLFLAFHLLVHRLEHPVK